jgi:hypothetical protein
MSSPTNKLQTTKREFYILSFLFFSLFFSSTVLIIKGGPGEHSLGSNKSEITRGGAADEDPGGES